MYNLPSFKESDQQKVITFIKQNPFAFICGCDSQKKPVATQIPCFIEERSGQLFLMGHIMKNTDHHLAFEQNANVLAVFTSAHSYVSASWYSDPHTASTWNYMSVHAKGIMRFLNEAALLQILKHTTNHFENNPASPANFEHLPGEYVAKLTKGIVAFEIEVQHLDNVFKLSQNKDKISYDTIESQLQQKEDSHANLIAAEMKSRKDKLFR